MSKNNMKGLLKGLRYISQIFEEEEEEEEFQIGLPTDVKHVAHIGSDGPSANAPSWMNDFNSDPNASQQNNGDVTNDISRNSQATTKKSAKESTSRDLPTVPKSRQQSSVDNIGSIESANGSPTSGKSKPSKKKNSKHRESTSPKGTGESSNTHGAPNVPKKTRKKKSKENDGSSTRSKDRSRKGSRHGSRHGSGDESMTNNFSSNAC